MSVDAGHLRELAHDLQHVSFVDGDPFLYGDRVKPRHLMSLLTEVHRALIEAANAMVPRPGEAMTDPLRALVAKAIFAARPPYKARPAKGHDGLPASEAVKMDWEDSEFHRDIAFRQADAAMAALNAQPVAEAKCVHGKPWPHSVPESDPADFPTWCEGPKDA